MEEHEQTDKRSVKTAYAVILIVAGAVAVTALIIAAVPFVSWFISMERQDADRFASFKERISAMSEAITELSEYELSARESGDMQHRDIARTGDLQEQRDIVLAETSSAYTYDSGAVYVWSHPPGETYIVRYEYGAADRYDNGTAVGEDIYITKK